MGRTLSGDSANVINLPASTTGFTAGDYVYQSAAGYGVVPTGALTTGMFNAPVATYSATATTCNELTYVEQLGGSQGSQVAAQLVNTNIVYVYATGQPGSYASAATVNFRIETTAGVAVVAQTSTTMTVQGPSQVSVIALPAGGFAIVCTPNGGGDTFSLSARFYNADGTAATAVLNASLTLTGTNATSRLKLQSLSDGSVIIGYVAAGVFSLRKLTTAGFDATFGTSGLVSVVTHASPTQFWDFATDSSNNIQVIFNTNTISLTMRRYNASGVQQTTSSVTSLTGIVAVAITITSDAVIRGFAHDGAGLVVITWDGTTAAVGTRINSLAMASNAALGAFAQGASGGYVIFYSFRLSSSSGIGLFLQPFSSANTALASAVRVNPAIGMNYRNQFTPIVVSGNTRVYFGTYPSNSVAYTLNTNVTPMGIAYFAYSNSTYALVGTPATGAISVGPYSLGAYLRGASTATIASFTIATTGSYSTSYAAGSTVIAKTFIDGSNAVRRLVLAPLPNGEFVAVWARIASPYQIFISKYSSTGVLLTGPVTVEASGSTSSNTHAVSTFANGNILVAYGDSTTSSTLRYRIYTSSLTVVTSGDIDTATSSTPKTSITSFGDGSHIAVSFLDSSNNIHVRAVKNDGTVTARLGPGLTVTTTWNYPQVIGLKSSGFLLAAQAQDGSNNSYCYGVRQTGASSFVASGSATIQSGSNYGSTTSDMLASPIPSPGTTAYFLGTNSVNTAYRVMSMNPLFNAANSLDVLNFTGAFAALSLGSDATPAAIGYTATGTPVIVAGRAATNFITLSPFTMSLNGSTSVDVAAVTTTTLATQSGSAFNVSAIPHVGEAILIGYLDANRYPAFASIAAMSFSVNPTLTAGVDASTTTLGLTPESGYSLQGISVTAAASGSIGLVQTRGTATLNSNYSASTPATFFDFRNPLTFGANGIVIGRTVTMGNN